jgi:hypothetical protein
MKTIKAGAKLAFFYLRICLLVGDYSFFYPYVILEEKKGDKYVNWKATSNLK